MKLVDMKLPKGRRSTDQPAEVKPGDGPEYPYGLEISLDKEALKKLGLGREDFDLAKPGELRAAYKVSGINMNETQDDENISVRLQITKIAIGGAKPAARMTREELEGELS